jgi:hypothetical protein
MRRALKDPEFFQRFKTSFGVDATPLFPKSSKRWSKERHGKLKSLIYTSHWQEPAHCPCA